MAELSLRMRARGNVDGILMFRGRAPRIGSLRLVVRADQESAALMRLFFLSNADLAKSR
jgi:hypothetical protein